MALAQTQRFIDFQDHPRLRLHHDDHDDIDDYTLSMHSQPHTDVDIDEDQPIYIPLESNKLNRNTSFGNSWGVSSVGRGFDWKWKDNREEEHQAQPEIEQQPHDSLDQFSPFSKKHSSPSLASDSFAHDVGQRADRQQAKRQGSLDSEESSGPEPLLTGISIPLTDAQAPALAIFTGRSPMSPSSTISSSSQDEVASPQEFESSLMRPPPLRSQSMFHVPSLPPIHTSNPARSASTNRRNPIWSRPVSPASRSPSLSALKPSPSAPMLASRNTFHGPMSAISPNAPRSPRLTRSRQSQKRISLIAGREVTGLTILGAGEDDDNRTDDGASEWLSFGRRSRRTTRGTPIGSGYASPRPLTPPGYSPVDGDDDDPTPVQGSRRSTSPSPSVSSASPPDGDSFIGRALSIKSLGRLGNPPTPLRLASQTGVPIYDSTSPSTPALIRNLNDGFSALQSPLAQSPFPTNDETEPIPPAPQYPSLDVPNPSLSLARLSSSWSLASMNRHSHTPSTSSRPARSPSRSTSLEKGTIKRVLSHASHVSNDSRKGGFLGGRTIDDYVILGEAGRGAYGLVKRAKERRKKEVVIGDDGEETLVGDFPDDATVGHPLIIKQIIKSRILADCWKKHPIHGTIPIEIFVMSALYGTSYVLPKRRAWDPRRFEYARDEEEAPLPQADQSISPALVINGVTTDVVENGVEEEEPSALDNWKWNEGDLIKGHPNICPLEDFFEDHHYYYLVLPATKPSFPVLPEGTVCAHNENGKTPSDLFDLVELYPEGLPSPLVRSFLGQIADALSFLHARGICHRDIKDENVVLGENGRCWLIDFGSSGVIRKNGWDSFSGTLDYAAPEILHGDRYAGPPQDVWAFGIVAYVLLTGECPFSSAAEAANGLEDPECKAAVGLRTRCRGGPAGFDEGREKDGGGRLGDAMELVLRCLEIDVKQRPTMEEVLTSRFINGGDGWGHQEEQQA